MAHDYAGWMQLQEFRTRCTDATQDGSNTPPIGITEEEARMLPFFTLYYYPAILLRLVRKSIRLAHSKLKAGAIYGGCSVGRSAV